MAVEVLKDGIELPAPNNLTWIFKVKLNGGEPVRWKVDSFDLNSWFRDVVGRYPRHEKGDRDEKDDILENWSQVEPRLREEAEKQAQLPMKVVVRGERTTSEDWEWSQSVAESDLPPLNDLQKEAARKLNIPEEAYRRSYAAGQRSLATLLESTDRVGRYLLQKLKQLKPDGEIQEITLDTFQDKYALKLHVQGKSMTIRIEESVIDDLFEAGSSEAERKIERVFEIALLSRAIQ
jgi:hypothetical protein